MNKLGAKEGARNGRAVARFGLALTAAMLVVAMLLAPSSGASGLGGPVVRAQPSGSSTAPPGPTGPAIAFLNPSVMPVTVGPPDTADPPVIADKPENATSEEGYDIVAWVANLA